ncbi:hypothetical protein M0765_021015 [Variovorax sp. S2]|nr:hypothetical protein [Variovorax sp. S12S4]MCR8960122.1 hypothetical protein [Variovorax sp. S12S4]
MALSSPGLDGLYKKAGEIKRGHDGFSVNQPGEFRAVWLGIPASAI